jgi:5-(carboxyamino)imidazole ribonucleotide synthase
MIAPGGAIGILGGGQLGRMLALAAARLGLKSHIFCPPGDNPGSHVCDTITLAEYDDIAACGRFAASVDVVTYEFENVPVACVERIAAMVAVRPGIDALRISQDRLTEKIFLSGLGITTAPFASVGDAAALTQAVAQIGLPAILKTRRLGYDGRGQAALRTPADVADAWARVGAAASILEGFADFEREISVIAARGLDGAIACYDPPENIHRNGILDISRVPAPVSQDITDAARALTTRILIALDYVGVIGVEFFVLKNGALAVNEFAPRVHNSGHWTLDACAISQFEQHIRAICGWPMGDPARHSNAEMRNLIGDDVNDWAELARTQGACLHLYGKDAPRPGRKMGHMTRLFPWSSLPVIKNEYEAN